MGPLSFSPIQHTAGISALQPPCLYVSYDIHNVVSWMKIKLFVSQLGSALFIGTVILVTPYWVAEMYLNSAYFNGLGNDSFTFTRPWEVVVRYNSFVRNHDSLRPSCTHADQLPQRWLVDFHSMLVDLQYQNRL